MEDDPALPADRNRNFSDEIHRAVFLATGQHLGNVRFTAKGKTRNNFSIMHQRAAERFAAALLAHEEAFKDAGWGEHFEICCDYGSAGIILSFAAIEAAMAEALDDLQIRQPIRDAIDRAPTLGLAQAILALVGAEAFPTGAKTYQRANLLREVRNGLVHPKAEWSDNLKTHAMLSKRVVATHVALSPFAPNAAEAFPRGCMSSAFVTWAAKTSREFIHEFRIKASLRSPLPPIAG